MIRPKKGTKKAREGVGVPTINAFETCSEIVAALSLFSLGMQDSDLELYRDTLENSGFSAVTGENWKRFGGSFAAAGVASHFLDVAGRTEFGARDYVASEDISAMIEGVKKDTRKSLTSVASAETGHSGAQTVFRAMSKMHSRKLTHMECLRKFWDCLHGKFILLATQLRLVLISCKL